MDNLLTWRSFPAKPLRGDISVPGDKSISHRALMLASIAEGVTRIDGFLNGADCLATLQALKALGVTFVNEDHQLEIQGVGKQGFQSPHQAINCGNSGTTMRLLAGLMAAQPFDSQLVGDDSLHRRPMQRITTPLRTMGADMDDDNGFAPLQIHAVSALQGINYQLPVASAQVKSCLLLAGLHAKGKTTLTELAVTRDHTERMLKAFSYPLEQHEKVITLDGGYALKATQILVPGDFSSAIFFIVAATLLKGSEIILRNIGVNPTRLGALAILESMGADIEVFNLHYAQFEPVADLRVKAASLRGVAIPSELVALSIDEFPALFIAAACAQGETSVQGAKELRFKESDRLAVMAEGLAALGITVRLSDDGLRIQGSRFSGGTVHSQGDHRVAMAFSVAGALACDPVTIIDCANVVTSFPGFIQVANQLDWNVQETFLYE